MARVVRLDGFFELPAGFQGTRAQAIQAMAQYLRDNPNQAPGRFIYSRRESRGGDPEREVFGLRSAIIDTGNVSPRWQPFW